MVEGITLMHVNGWMFELESVVGARVSGVREIGWRCNNDGIDIVSSQDVLVEDCFLRSADDAIAVKGQSAHRAAPPDLSFHGTASTHTVAAWCFHDRAFIARTL